MAWAYWQEGGDLAEKLDDEVGRAWITQLTAYVAMGEGRLDEAGAMYERVLASHRAMGDEPAMVISDAMTSPAPSPPRPRASGSPFPSTIPSPWPVPSRCSPGPPPRRETPGGPRPSSARWTACGGRSAGCRSATCGPTTTSATPLTHRESQIAELIAQGVSNKEISTTLVIAQRTVEGHVEHILAKLNFTSRAQIAVWVVAKRPP